MARRWIAFAVLVLPSLAAAATPEIVVRGVVRVGERPAWRAAVLLDRDPPGVAPPGRARLDEAWLSFVPKVQVVAPGTRLGLGNHDEASHSVRARLGGQPLFDFATAPGGGEQEAVLSRPGVVTVSCAMHDEMRAFLVVAATPWHAITDEDGRFEIAAPPGRYRVRAFHEAAAPPAPGEIGPTLATIVIEATPLQLALRLDPAPAHLAAVPAAIPAPPIRSAPPRWLRELGAAQGAGWPHGVWVYLLSTVAMVLGLGLAVGNLRLTGALGGSRAAALTVGCALTFGASGLIAVGLHGVVACALGLGILIGTAVFGAAEPRSRRAS